MSFVVVVLIYLIFRLMWLGCLGYINSRDKEVGELNIVILINEERVFFLF